MEQMMIAEIKCFHIRDAYTSYLLDRTPGLLFGEYFAYNWLLEEWPELAEAPNHKALRLLETKAIENAISSVQRSMAR